VELDPQSGAAHTALSLTYLSEWGLQWSQDPQTLEHALTLARKAVALDDTAPLAHQLLGTAYLLKKQPERARVEAERVIALDPNSGDGYGTLADILTFTGRPEEAIVVLEKALRLNPRFPAFLLASLGRAYQSMGQYTEALDVLQQALPLNPNALPAHE